MPNSKFRQYHSTRRDYGTLPRLKSKGPFSWPSLGLVLLAAAGAVWYGRKLRREKAGTDSDDSSAGRASIGGPFCLTDTNGKERTDGDFRGSWSVVYFGYTFCPDICPEELDKLGTMLDILDKEAKARGLPLAAPLFISVDPERDTPQVLGKYLKDFHPRIIGLTGSVEQVHTATKAFRVYHAKSPADEDNDYLVDHSMYMYLMGPDGCYVDHYTRQCTADTMATSIMDHMARQMKKESLH